MVHKPSVPKDLDHPRRLWARATALGMLATAGLEGDDYRLAAGRLRCDSQGGSYWWRMSLHGAGRAVFCGQDADGSHGHLRRVPVDFLAGGPGWLPWRDLRAEQDDCALGYVYWWHDGAWARAPYPDDLVDDGLGLSAAWVGDDAELVLLLSEAAEAAEAAEAGAQVSGALVAFLDRAEEATVDGAAVRALLGAFTPTEPPKPQAVESALDFAARAALTPGGVPRRGRAAHTG
ncbi:hypothetical protein [Streptomyces sp. MP131-18]|uniref:hypothetical protein n=1 Tax=Streptomyces sp. MP131-18 TaxID=1857892 RepID=UPI0009A20984|nr:hypothetical protein [Streptomyces sp. MP131-18]ONK13723.1 hypothetical protein STBA_44960 [Streptomyces sp. MP131-18]